MFKMEVAFQSKLSQIIFIFLIKLKKQKVYTNRVLIKTKKAVATVKAFIYWWRIPE